MPFYANIGLRPMVDADLLVPAACVEAAVRVLHDLGYRPAGPIMFDADLHLRHHLPPFFRQAGVMLELH